jgi:hypothetical protein
MPRGTTSKYTQKQKRQASHIEEGSEKRSSPRKAAASRAWATVNKQSGDGKKVASTGRGASASRKASSPRTRVASARAQSGRGVPGRTVVGRGTASRSAGARKPALRKSAQSRSRTSRR